MSALFSVGSNHRWSGSHPRSVCTGCSIGVPFHEGASPFRSCPNNFNSNASFPRLGQSAFEVRSCPQVTGRPDHDSAEGLGSPRMIGSCPPTHITHVAFRASGSIVIRVVYPQSQPRTLGYFNECCVGGSLSCSQYQLSVQRVLSKVHNVVEPRTGPSVNLEAKT